MLDTGYTERDLRNLGIQYSPAMINRYYHTDAGKVPHKVPLKVPHLKTFRASFSQPVPIT